MTKFLFHGIIYSFQALSFAFLTAIAIIKVDSICDVSCMNQFDQPPPFLKIKKIGVHKQITSPQATFFQCSVDKACMELHATNYSCKEILTHISGNMQTKDFNKMMSFTGKEGLLNYQDYTLNIRNCQFQMFPIQADNQEETSLGEMKTLVLSMRR